MTRLQELFQRNGYVRVPDLERRKEVTAAKYKKGWEVRLVLKSENELEEARDLLKRAGFRAGKPFKKARQWAQPVYGKRAVESLSSDTVHRV